MARGPTDLASAIVELKRQGRQIGDHITKCERLNQEKAAAMATLAEKVGHLATQVEGINGRFESIDELTATLKKFLHWAWRGVLSIIGSVVLAGATVVVTVNLQHNQTQNTAAQAAHAATNSAGTASETLAEARAIEAKLDKLNHN